MAASSTRSKTTAKKAASKAKPEALAKSKVSAKSKASAKPAEKAKKARPEAAKVEAVPAKKVSKKGAAEAPEVKAEPAKKAKTSGKAAKSEAIAEPKAAKKVAKAEPSPEPKAAKKAAKAEPSPEPKATKKKGEASVEPPKAAKKAAKSEASAEPKATKKAVKKAQSVDFDAELVEPKTKASESSVVLPASLPEVVAAEPIPPVERKKSVLEIAEEDDEYASEQPRPSLEDLDTLLGRLHELAQFGTEVMVREELPPMLELLEQIDDPTVLPRLLALFEDNDEHGVYWNILYVLENFDAWLQVLLDGLPSLYHRAPEWAYTCVIRILRTRGDEDDCTAAFEQLICAGPSETRTLMVRLLRELAAHPDTEEEQRQNIARTIAAIGGDTSTQGSTPDGSAHEVAG